MTEIGVNEFDDSESRHVHRGSGRESSERNVASVLYLLAVEAATARPAQTRC